MPKLHYAGKEFELPAGYDVTAQMSLIERVRSTGNARVGVATVPLASGGVLSIVVSDWIPFAFETDAPAAK